MANEGIMAAPMPMQQQQQQPPQGYVSSLDAYNAASSAMQETDPQAFGEYKTAIGSKLSALNLKPSEIEAFITLLEYMMQYPDQYGEVIRAGIEEGAIEEGDFPAEFDQGFITTMLAALNEQRIQQAQNVSPEAMGPGPQEPMAMKSGGLADAAQALQARGRNRDTMLAHINPQEAAMLRRAGGLGTINPYTGLPEYFSLKSVWKAVTAPVKEVVNVVKDVAKSDIGRIALTIGATMALGPAGLNLGLGMAGTGAIVGGGMAALGGGNLQDVLKGAAMGYIGGTVAPSISSYMPGAAGSLLNQGLTGAALGTGFGLASGMSAKDALKAGAVGGVTAAGVGYGQQKGYIPGGRVDLGTDPADLATMEKLGTNGIPINENLSIDPVGTAAENLPPQDVIPSAGSEIGPNGVPYEMDPKFGYVNATADQLARANQFEDPLGALAVDERYTDIDRSYADQFKTAPVGAQTSPAPPPEAASVDQPRLTPQQIESYVTKPTPTALERFTEGARGLYNKASDAVVGGYNEYLSPSRPAIQQQNQEAILAGTRARGEYIQAAKAEGIVPTSAGADAAYQTAYEASAPGFFAKYAPMAAAGLGATYLAGGFEAPVEPGDNTPIYDPAYTGTDYMRDNPQAFSGSLYNYQSQGAGAYDPTRATLYAGGQGAAAPGVVAPTGIMQAQYSPEYGRRRTQSIQQYYSPFIGTAAPIMAAKGGSIREFPRKSGPINGPGTGTSDDIPAMLSDGEFVFTARAVRNAGNGSRRKGAARMYKLMKSLEKGGMVKG